MKKIITLLMLTGTCFGGQLTQTTAELQSILDDADQKAGVYAVLTAASNTTCAATGTWYQIQGVFTNKAIEGFTISGTNIVNQIATTNQYEIDWHAIASADEASGSIIHATVKINDTVYDTEKMGAECRVAGDRYNFSGTVVAPLSSNDTVQLVCETDDAGGTITFHHFVTSITKFFLTRD
mgnify:CR=1 FL=1